MRISEMVNTSMARQRLAAATASSASATRRLSAGTLRPSDDPTGFVISTARRVDASTNNLAAAAARHHLGVLSMADATAATISSALIALRTDIVGGHTDLAARSASTLDMVAAALTGARHGNIAVFAGEAGTAREYKAAVPAVEAADPTAATLRTGPLTLDGAALDALADDGLAVSFTIDGVARDVVVAPGGSYADVAEFAAAFVSAAGDAGVAAAFDGGRLTVTAAVTGATSHVAHVAGGNVLGFDSAQLTAGADAIEAVEGSDEVLARGVLPQQFRIVVGRPPRPTAPEPADGEPAEEVEVDPDAAYVVPPWQTAVTVARMGLDTLGLEGFDPAAPDALTRIDDALATIGSQRSSYGAQMATLERVESLSATQAATLEALDARSFGVDVGAELYRLAAARISAQAAAAAIGATTQQARHTMSSLLGSILDVDA